MWGGKTVAVNWLVPAVDPGSPSPGRRREKPPRRRIGSGGAERSRLAGGLESRGCSAWHHRSPRSDSGHRGAASSQGEGGVVGERRHRRRAK